jgi:NADPH2:quinone reductase
MKAVELSGYKGLDDLRVVEVPKPKLAAHECLIEVKATGINFAELELTHGRYRIGKEPPFIMGFEAAGVVRQIGETVKNLKIGDRVTTIVSSGGYAGIRDGSGRDGDSDSRGRWVRGGNDDSDPGRDCAPAAY